MSTVIDNAFLLPENAPLLPLIESIKRELVHCRHRILIRIVSNYWFDRFDGYGVSAGATNPPTWSELEQRLGEEDILPVVWFFKHPDGKRLLVMGSRATESFLPIMFSVSEDYSYWNITDRPPEVSETEWLQRRDVWEKVMPKGIPGVESLFSVAATTSFWAKMDYPTRDTWHQWVPQLSGDTTQRYVNILAGEVTRNATSNKMDAESFVLYVEAAGKVREFLRTNPQLPPLPVYPEDAFLDPQKVVALWGGELRNSIQMVAESISLS